MKLNYAACAALCTLVPVLAGAAPAKQPKKSPPAAKSKKAAPAPTWREDLTGVRIPEAPASGRLHGEPFKMDRAEVERGIVRLRHGTGPEGDRQFAVFLFLAPDEKPDGRVYKITRESGISAPQVHMTWKGSDGKDGFEHFTGGGYVMLLKLGTRKGNKLPGRIYLCVGDTDKSFVAGTFNAELK
jgi:hypothetical protein